MLNWLTKICNAWKKFTIGTGLDSDNGPPPELSSARKRHVPGLKGTRSFFRIELCLSTSKFVTKSSLLGLILFFLPGENVNYVCKLSTNSVRLIPPVRCALFWATFETWIAKLPLMILYNLV